MRLAELFIVMILGMLFGHALTMVFEVILT